MVFTNQTPPTGTVSLTFSNAILARGLRLYATKLSSDGADCYLQIAEFKALGTEPWAYPSELRGKKVIDAGQFSTLNLNDANAPTPKYLADNPDYLANHPFDGVTIPVKLDMPWTTNQGLISDPPYGLLDLVMTKLPIPWSQLQSAAADLNRVSWGRVTENFLWHRVRTARGAAITTRVTRWIPTVQTIGLSIPRNWNQHSRELVSERSVFAQGGSLDRGNSMTSKQAP